MKALMAAALALLLFLVWRKRVSAPDRAGGFRFDPERVAFYEAAGWRAYYDRRWPHLFSLVVRLCQEQFQIPFPVSLLAAYDVARAAAAWAPVDHDPATVREFYARFYRLARHYSGLDFDPDRVAALELEYNDIHRRLVGNPDKREFVATMTDLHSALFGLARHAVRESAELHVEANNVVDRITGRHSIDEEADWQLLEDLLRGCYASIDAELRATDLRAIDRR